jgi:hypothetical protein
MNANQATIDEQDERIQALRQAIRDAFPDVAYSGQITPCDGSFTPKLDDDQILYESLKGRSWTEIARDLLMSQPDGYLLLTDQAYAAFLAAWLTVSLEEIDRDENTIREFLCYSCSPTLGQNPDLTEWKRARIGKLTTPQRRALRAVLTEFTERGTNPFVKGYAVRALEFIDSLG